VGRHPKDLQIFIFSLFSGLNLFFYLTDAPLLDTNRWLQLAKGKKQPQGKLKAWTV
jgi:hypothetical protein